MTDAACIFCKIAQHATPADVLHESEETIFFRDIRPKAKVHIVAIPKTHVASLAQLTSEHAPVVGQLLYEAAEVAVKAGIAASGYRVITNVRGDAGQEVPHLHFHILGGEPLGPMRC